MKKRLLAAIIDGFLFIILFSIATFTGKNLSDMGYREIIAIFIYYFLIDFIFLTSPGKWLYNLKITTTYYQKPVKYWILLRSLIKVLIIGSVLGVPLMVILLLMNREPVYDTMLGLTVSRSDI